MLSVISGYNPIAMTDWLTISEVARYLRLSPSTVYKLKARGVLRGYRVGRNLRFDRAEIDADIKRKNKKQKSRREVGSQK